MLLLALLMIASTPSQADDSCVPFPVPTGSLYAAFSQKVAQEVQEGCGTIKMTWPADPTSSQQRDKAVQECCVRAKAFIDKNPLPDAEPAQLQYSLMLSQEVCDKMTGHWWHYKQQFESNQRQCSYNVARAMQEPEVDKIADECDSKANHKVEKNDEFGDNLAHQMHADSLINHGRDAQDQSEFSYDCRHGKMKDLLSKLNSQSRSISSSSIQSTTVKMSDKAGASTGPDSERPPHGAAAIGAQ